MNSGRGDWEDAYVKARALVGRMTDGEKNNVCFSSLSLSVSCHADCFLCRLPPQVPLREAARGSRGRSRDLGFRVSVRHTFVLSESVLPCDVDGYTGLNDGPAGVRVGVTNNNTLSTGFPAQLSVGAGWNRGLAYARAVQMGKEFKAKGIDVALSPVIGPIGRVARGGRNWVSGFPLYLTPRYRIQLTASALIGRLRKRSVSGGCSGGSYDQRTAGVCRGLCEALCWK